MKITHDPLHKLRTITRYHKFTTSRYKLIHSSRIVNNLVEEQINNRKKKVYLRPYQNFIMELPREIVYGLNIFAKTLYYRRLIESKIPLWENYF